MALFTIAYFGQLELLTMECRENVFCKFLKFLLLMASPFLGVVLLAWSHAIYMQEKTNFYANNHSAHFEESIIVESLDIVGGMLFALPLLFVGNMVVKRILEHIRAHRRLTCRAQGACRFLQ